MVLEFSAEVWYWRGPAPFFFVSVPDGDANRIKEIERLVTYGWGMIPATVEIGPQSWPTALWPKNGTYVVPLKLAIRTAAKIDVGDVARLRLLIAE